MKDQIDLREFADASELDEFLTPEELTEAEVIALERQTIAQELDELATRMQKSIDRVRYYGEVIDSDEFDFLHREVLRIRKNLD